MTATSSTSSQSPAPVEEVDLTIDGVEVSVPKGTLIIRAAEQLGIQIPRFCDHPLLKPAGACRQCLVMVAMPDREGNVRPMPKPQASCTMEVSNGMVVNTQRTSEVADKAQEGVMEFLLINHPLDCPVCDKGGECPLQNQALSNGRSTSRFTDVKRTYAKPIKISTEILLDRDRCILCQRCTRFSAEIAGDPFIDLQGRGGGLPGGEEHGMVPEQIGTFDEGILGFSPFGTDDERELVRAEQLAGPSGQAGVLSGISYTVGSAELDATGRPFASYFSGNTIQICPVGALTSATYRFRSRPFDLVSTPSIGEHDACGAAIRIDHRRGVVLRRLAGDDPAVNEEWLSDKDRFAFPWQSLPDAIETPLVRDEETGELVPTSWSEAITLAAQGLAQAADDGGVGVLPGGRLTLEDSYAWSKFARVVLGTNDIDFRARAHSAEEAEFLGHAVAGVPMAVSYGDLERAPHVLLAGLEPEEEAATIFLRLRKAVLAKQTSVSTIAPFASRGSTKMRAEVIPTVPGAEADALVRIAAAVQDDDSEHAALAAALGADGAVILVGERLAQSRGGLTAAQSLAQATGAALVWVPRRAGDRGAVEVGLLPGLLPGGRPVADAEARVDVAGVWGLDSVPEAEGRDLTAILADAGSGELAGLLLGGIDIEDLPGSGIAEQAVRDADFVVQLEVRNSALSRYADVVLPVASPTHKSGTFLNWEGRPRPFGQVFATHARSDAQVLDMLAAQLDVELGTASLEDVHRELSEFGAWDGTRQAAPTQQAQTCATEAGQYTLASWRLLLDAARGQDGEPHLAGTANRAVVRVSAATAAGLDVGDGDNLTVTGPLGAVTLPTLVTTMPDQVVWVPLHSPGCSAYRMLGVGAGGSVQLSVPGAASAEVNS
ncbi:MAG: NADH-quinone oxidoreductase subunit G [Beutenbergiaceae bacterium]